MSFMELSTVWATLLRRWYLTLVGLLIAIGVTVLIVGKIGPTYKAEGSVLLFPPITTIKNGTTVETQGNPYLLLGGLSQARDIVIRSMNSRFATDEFAQLEPLASYEVTPDFSTSGPVIVIDVTSDSSTAAVRGLNTAIARVPGTLTSLQSGLGLPQSAYITSIQLTADKVPETVRSGQIRSGILVGAVVGVIALFLVGLSDGLLRGRGVKPRSRHGRHDRRTKESRVENERQDSAPLHDPPDEPQESERRHSGPHEHPQDRAPETTLSR